MQTIGPDLRQQHGRTSTAGQSTEIAPIPPTGGMPGASIGASAGSVPVPPRRDPFIAAISGAWLGRRGGCIPPTSGLGAGSPVTDSETGTVRARLAELGLVLHGPHPPHDPLDAVVVHDGVARTSGQLPRIDGRLTCCGVLGRTVSVEEGAEAAAVCALNALAVLESELGTLDRVERVLTVTGYVASAPDFHRQPDVVDGASAILYQVFGESGRHTRSAVGVAALPRGGAVEIELTVSLRDRESASSGH